MTEHKFIRTIQLTNFLSYGEGADIVELEPLNVLIGPNCSGKSNLIEAFALLQATPKDLTAPIREGGGVTEWLYKGKKGTPVAEINVTLNYPHERIPFRYRLSFTKVGQRFELVDEAVECERPTKPDEEDVYFFYRYNRGNPVLNAIITPPVAKETHTVQESFTPYAKISSVAMEPRRMVRSLRREDLDIHQSVLSQRKDPDQYPELTYLANEFSRIELYREWNLGRYTPPRLPQKADLPEDFLIEDASNLGLVLNDLQHQPGTKRLIIEKLKIFDEGIEDITTRIHGGTVQIFLHQKGLTQPIPATRLSDGTLRYLCLLTLLCHPAPPSVLCIEEPELGLHPDILPTIAELLIEASDKTQLIVTTHSDILVSALSDTPESVLVCERDDTGTHLRRLKKGREGGRA
ncbi:MAG: AAA family ATPase [Deltaproteobacteria bacterium]|nr:AAA family ATPase [Deltaproteobacteria bacterium]MBW1792908.1 AAA family ATPase [Deltaproteobacteria bacterium]